MIVVFESNPEIYYWLINNIKLNNANNIHLMPYALGDSIGTAELYIPKTNIEASSFIKDHLLRNPLGNLGLLKRFRVPVITLDHFLENARRLIGRDVNGIDIMKVDVEGYELKVLMGAEKALGRGVIDRFVIEVHIDQVSTVDVVKLLSEYGYKPMAIKHFNNVKDMVYLKLFK